jgi:hypothetical protein
VLTADGDHEAGAAHIRMRVVEGSGTEGLEGIAGDGTLEAPGGANGTYTFAFRFDG